MSNLQALIEEKTDGIFGLVAAFTAARSSLGDEHLQDFLEAVPEKGEALWVRFRDFQKANTKPNFEPTFMHFIVSVLFPDGLASLG